MNVDHPVWGIISLNSNANIVDTDDVKLCVFDTWATCLRGDLARKAVHNKCSIK